MGQSTPTTTTAIDTFVERYAAFRSELSPREQMRFDDLVCAARRHGNAINRRPHLDFERPVLLVMLVEAMQELEHARAELRATRRQLDEVCYALRDAGLVVRRVPSPTPELLDRLGQTRLQHVEAPRALHA